MDGDQLLLRGGQRLLGVHKQIEKHLLQLALRAQHEERFARGQIAHADPGRLPVAFAEFDQAAEESADIHRPRVHLFGRGVRNQAGDHAGGLGSLRRDGRYLALRRTSVRLVERLVRQAGDGGKRSLQLIHDAGDQPAHGRHFLGAEQLLLNGPLIEQADRHADLVAEVLRQGLFVGSEIAHLVVLVQFEHADDFALGDHRHEQQALRRTIAVLGGHREWAAVDIGDHQQRPVMETGHGARRGSAGRRRERNRFRLHAVFLNRIERFGGAIVNEKFDPGDADDSWQGLGNTFQDGRRRGSAEDLLAQLIGTPQPPPLRPQAAFAAPQEESDQQDYGNAAGDQGLGHGRGPLDWQDTSPMSATSSSYPSL